MNTCTSPLSSVTVRMMARKALRNGGLAAIKSFNPRSLEMALATNPIISGLNPEIFKSKYISENKFLEAIVQEYNLAVDEANARLENSKDKKSRRQKDKKYQYKDLNQIQALLLGAVELKNLETDEINTFLKDEAEAFEYAKALGLTTLENKSKNAEISFENHNKWYESVFGNAITAEQELKKRTKIDLITPNAIVDYENRKIPISSNSATDDVNRGIQLSLAKRMVYLANKYLGVSDYDELNDASNNLTENQESILATLGDNWDNLILDLSDKLLTVERDGEIFEFKGELLEQAARSDKYGSKNILNEQYSDLLDFITIRDYDHVLRTYSGNIISVSSNKLFEFGKLNFYIKPEGEDKAPLFNFDKMANAADLISKTTKYLYSTMSIFDYSTGLAIEGKTLDHLTVWQAINALGYVNMQNNEQGIVQAISEFLKGNHNQGLKNVLYSVYKNIFETIDGHPGIKKSGDVKSLANIKGSNTLVAAFISELSTVENRLIEIEQEDGLFVTKATNDKATFGADIKLQTSMGNHITRFLYVRDLIIGQFNLTTDDFSFKGISRTGSTLDPKTTDQIIAQAYKTLLGVDILATSTVGVRMLDSIKAQLGQDYQKKLLDGIFNTLVLWSEIDNTFNDDATISKINSLKHGDSISKAGGLINISKDPNTKLPKLKIKLMAAGQGSLSTAYIFKTLANAAKVANGELGKATMVNLKGNSEARYTKRNMAYTMRNNFERFNRINRSVVSGEVRPFANNFFVSNPSNLKSVNIRSAIKSDEETKANADINVEEHIFQMMDIMYAGKLAADDDIVIDFTNFSDKTVNYMAVIDKSSRLSRNEDGTISSWETAREKLKAQNKSYINGMAKLTANKYKTIADAFSKIFGIDSYNPKDDTVEDLTDVVSHLKSKLKGKSFEFELNTGEVVYLTGWDAIRQVAAIEDVELIHLLDYQGKTENNKTPKLEDIGPSESFVDELKMMNDVEGSISYDDYMEQKLDIFVNELKSFGVNTFDEFQSKEWIKATYPTSGSYVYKVVDGKKIIHPFIRKFFYEWNIVSSGIMQATVGNIWQHKGGSKSDKLITQTKRNVAFTAQYMKYISGNKFGLRKSAKIAQMADFTNDIKPIANTEQTVTCLDGATLMVGNYYSKVKESFGGEYAPNGGVDQKSFYSSMDPRTGIFTIIKHAAFAMTPSWINMTKGSDIDLLDVHKKLFEDISYAGLDITKSSDKRQNGKPLNEFSGVYFYDKINIAAGETNNGSDIYELNKINKLPSTNMYELVVTNMATMKIETRQVRIDNMYDLWQALGGERSLEKTTSKTAYTSGNKYFKQSLKSFDELSIFESLYDGGLKQTVVELESIISRTEEGRNILTRGLDKFLTQSINDELILEELMYFETDDEDINALISQVKTLRDNGSLITYPYQPLKGKSVELLSFGGTIKAGTGLINSPSTISKEYLSEKIKLINSQSDGTEKISAIIDMPSGVFGIDELHTVEMDHNDSGMQVNTEHHIDHAELSIPKQMLNATSFGGKTIADSNALFRALASMVESSLEEYFRDHPINQEEGKSEEEVKDIVKDYQNKVIENIDRQLKKKFKDKDDVVNISRVIVESFDNIPIDSAYIKNEAITEIISSLSKKAMKIKMPGIMSVINPTARMMQIHEVRGGILPVRNGNKVRYVELSTDKTIRLTGEKYQNWANYNHGLDGTTAQLLNNGLFVGINDLSKSEALESKGRELNGPELKLKLSNGEEFGISLLNKDFVSPLSSDRGMFKFLTSINKKKLPNEMSGSGLFLKDSTIAKAILEDEDMLKVINEYIKNPRVKASMRAIGFAQISDIKTLKTLNRLMDFLYKIGNDRLEKGEGYDLRTSQLNQLKRVFRNAVDSDITELSNGKIPEGLDDVIKESIGNNTFDAFVTPGEIVMPPIFRDRFMLNEGDDINLVSINLFNEKLTENIKVNNKGIDNYDIVAANSRGSHVYMFTNEQSFNENIGNARELIAKDGVIKNDLGDVVMQVTDAAQKIYATESGQILILLDVNAESAQEDISDLFEEIASSGIFKNIEFEFKRPEGEDDDIDMVEQAKKMYESFKQYLMTTGARIPGQHFQSFQALEIVDFIEDKDSAVFVPDAVTLYAGSDYANLNLKKLAQ